MQRRERKISAPHKGFAEGTNARRIGFVFFCVFRNEIAPSRRVRGKRIFRKAIFPRFSNSASFFTAISNHPHSGHIPLSFTLTFNYKSCFIVIILVSRYTIEIIEFQLNLIVWQSDGDIGIIKEI